MKSLPKSSHLISIIVHRSSRISDFHISTMIFTIYQQGDLDDHLGGVQLIYAGLNAPEGMCNIEHKYRLLKDAISMRKIS